MATSQEERKLQLIAGLVAMRARLLDAARSLPPDQRDVPFLGSWCIKDLLAHLAGWDHTNLQAIGEILAGTPPEFFRYHDKDWRTYNATLVEMYRIEPYADLLASVEASHQQLVEYLQSLPAGALLQGKVKRENGRTVTVRNLVLAETRDEDQHAVQVEAFLHKGTKFT